MKKSNTNKTTNNATAYKSTLSANVDLFASDWRITRLNQHKNKNEQLINALNKAFREDPQLAFYNLQTINPQAKISKIICFSDMQFDEQVGANQTIWNKWKDKFAAANLDFPQVIFWNINAKRQSFPVTINDLGVLCISGYSQHLLDLFSNDFQGTFDLKTQMVDLLVHKYQNNFKI